MFLLFFIIYLINLMAMKNIKLYILFTLCFTFVLLKKSNLRNTLDYSLENKEYQIHSYINDDNFNDTNIPTNELNKSIDIKPENTNEKKDNFPERHDNLTEKMEDSTQRNDNITNKNYNETYPIVTNKNETGINVEIKNETNTNVPNKTETNKPETNKTETNKTETNKPETNKPETNKTETNKTETNKTETNKTETNKPETNKPEINKAKTNPVKDQNSQKGNDNGNNKDNGKGFWKENWPWFMLGAVGLFALAIIIFMIYYITIKQYGDLDKKVKTISFRNEREDDEEDGGDLLK